MAAPNLKDASVQHAATKKRCPAAVRTLFLIALPAGGFMLSKVSAAAAQGVTTGAMWAWSSTRSRSVSRTPSGTTYEATTADDGRFFIPARESR